MQIRRPSYLNKLVARMHNGLVKVTIVKDVIKPHYDENGVFIIGLFDFLKSPDSLDV